jgi:hypothetical protein
MSVELIHSVELLHAASLSRAVQAKRAYTTRRVPLAAMTQLLSGESLQPRAGDLMLARVTRVGKHAHLEGPDSRRAALFVGDEIVVACAPRYAPDQFDARMPTSLGPCHLAAGGGVAGVVVARRGGLQAPTELQPLGLLADADGRVANLADHALPSLALAPSRRPVTIASLGTSMNAGKTTSAAYLIRGLTRAGLRVGAAKLTGTGSGNDPGLLRDAGAVRVLDFTDAGMASTCDVEPARLVAAAHDIMAHLADARVDAIVLEVADGLFQRETAALLQCEDFQRLLDATIFSAGDAMGACGGADWLRRHGLAPLALAGAMTRSPLAADEAAAASGLPVLGLDALGSADTARALWEQAAGQRLASVAA